MLKFVVRVFSHAYLAYADIASSSREICCIVEDKWTLFGTKRMRWNAHLAPCDDFNRRTCSTSLCTQITEPLKNGTKIGLTLKVHPINLTWQIRLAISFVCFTYEFRRVSGLISRTEFWMFVCMKSFRKQWCRLMEGFVANISTQLTHISFSCLLWSTHTQPYLHCTEFKRLELS